MKKIKNTLLFLTLSLLSFAQPAFTEKMLLAMNERMKADHQKFFKEEMTPDYYLAGSEGRILSHELLKGLYEKDFWKFKEWSVKDVKIQQFGKHAIATGIKFHDFFVIAKNKSNYYNERFTYLYEYRNGKWMWAYAQHTVILPEQTPNEEAAIKKALDDETMTFYANPSETFSKYWILNDKTFMMGNFGDKDKFTIMGGAKIEELMKTLKPSVNKGVKSNYRINIKGNIAIVDYDQVTTAADASKSYQHNLYLLENINGEWKFIGASVYNIPAL